MSDKDKFQARLSEGSPINKFVGDALDLPAHQRVTLFRKLNRNICSACGLYVGGQTVIDSYSGRGFCPQCDAR